MCKCLVSFLPGGWRARSYFIRGVWGGPAPSRPQKKSWDPTGLPSRARTDTTATGWRWKRRALQDQGKNVLTWLLTSICFYFYFCCFTQLYLAIFNLFVVKVLFRAEMLWTMLFQHLQCCCSSRCDARINVLLNLPLFRNTQVLFKRF